MRCGRQLEQQEQEYCNECVRKKHHYHRGYAIWQYDDAMRQSLGDFKYHARKEFADFYVAEAVRLYAARIRLEAPEVLIPIPIYRMRYWERGFNQAELLARGIGRQLGIPVDAEYLRRIKKTEALKNLNAREREAALAGAFAVPKEQRRKSYRSVMLVDDIYTTGVTADVISELLIQTGITEIYVMVVCMGKVY